MTLDLHHTGNLKVNVHIFHSLYIPDLVKNMKYLSTLVRSMLWFEQNEGLLQGSVNSLKTGFAGVRGS